MKWIYVVALLLAIGLVGALWWMQRPRPASSAEPYVEAATVSPDAETCLDCHAGMTGFSPFHDPAALGCFGCHGGDPTDPTVEGAHASMVVVPGNLSTAMQTCGGTACHTDLVNRVETSLMASGRGIVSVNRWVFGEQPTPNGTDGLADLGHSLADAHLQQLCTVCHLGTEKEAPGPVTELSRGGGCVACHVQYHDVRDAATHPALTVQVGNDTCFGCHSRSGRISTNYEGWHETLLTASEMPDSTNYRLLADERVFEQMPDDVHHAAGLACIDCHTSRETMGDGQVYLHQDAAVDVACTDCHTSEPPPTVGWADLDRESRMIVLLRHQQPFPDRKFVTTARRGTPLVNVFLDDTGQPVLEGKLDGTRRPLAAPVEACRVPGHERVTCQSCHTAWVPQCLGCHTQQDTEGRWREFASDFLAGPPTLGVRTSAAARTPDEGARIEPFAPGMIMTLNTHQRDVRTDPATLAQEGSFHRLFAPAVPHTTAAAGRSCASCHLDPVALGYGQGDLKLVRDDGTTGRWTFTPSFAALRDGLPADAWIPFLGERDDASTTRVDARPFSRVEQQRILRVGACLTCHDPTPANQRRIYDDFGAALQRVTQRCIVPRVGEAAF
ncbi:MAG: hypothetical protein GVY18_14615 [Bacteroidetes bacterium]|nr:hypothetical protein [Bacteroidota bacterium]